MKKIIKICDYSKWGLLVFAALIFAFYYDTPSVQEIVSDFVSFDFDLFYVFRGGQPSDPSHFGNF